MFEVLYRIRHWFTDLPNKKRYFELITAFLSIPVLLSVIFINYLSIQNKQDTDKTPTPAIITIIQSPSENSGSETIPTEKPTPAVTSQQCTPEIGPITITSPKENEIIKDNPLCITIDRYNPTNKFCAVVWSYRINNTQWSDYTDREICIYNLDSGQKTLELRVKSIVSGAESILKRIFTYENTQSVPTPTVTNTPTPTITPTATPAVSL